MDVISRITLPSRWQDGLHRLGALAWLRAFLLFANVTACAALEDLPTAAELVGQFPTHIQPLFQTYCMACHDTDTAKGGICLDQLSAQITSANIAIWTDVKNMLDVGAMPPAKRTLRPSRAEQDLLLTWIGSSLERFDADHRESGGDTLVRRVTHRAYANMVHSLLEVPAQGMESFPADGASNGFDTIGASLYTTGYLYDLYLSGAQKSFELALRFGARPKPLHFVSRTRDAVLHFLDNGRNVLTQEITELAQHPALARRRELIQGAHTTTYDIMDTQLLVQPVNAYFKKVVLDQYLSPTGGIDYLTDTDCIDKAVIPGLTAMRTKIEQMEATLPDFQPLFGGGGGPFDPMAFTCKVTVADPGYYRLGAILGLNDEQVPLPVSIIVDGQVVDRRMIDEPISAPADAQTTVYMVAGSHRIDVQVFENLVNFLNYVNAVHHSAYKGGDYYRPVWYVGENPLKPNIFVKELTVDGPLLEAWPTPAAARIFTRGVQSPLTHDYAEEIVAAFMRRACAGTCSAENREPYVDLIMSQYARSKDAVAAVSFGLSAALCSPTFLYLVQPQRTQAAQRRPLSGCELARQLAYVLWSDLPDEALLASGESGALLTDAELLAQSHRLLADPRSRAFREAFVTQWLKIDHLDSIAFAREEFPTIDGVLIDAARAESVGFFSHVLDDNLSIVSFLHADFTVLNSRLARLYGIPGVAGNQMRLVPLGAGSHRGGVLAQASVLMASSNGMVTSPVRRGAFIMERLLDISPGTPPPDVPALAKTATTGPDGITLLTPRERLALHRAITSCARCHDKIDPLGVGLENYDPLGAWNDQLQLFHAAVDKKPGFWEPRAADVHGTMLDGTPYNGPEELAARLSERKEQFARALTDHLLEYILGRSLELSDRAERERICTQLAAQGWGMGSMMDLIVTSPLFRSK